MSHTTPTTWHPRPEHLQASSVSALMRRLGVAHYDELLALSLRQPDTYWHAVLAHCQVQWDVSPQAYIDESRGAPFARWFPGGRLNWVNTVLAWSHRPETADQPAVIAEREDGAVASLSYRALHARVRRAAAGLAGMGIGRGDRVGLLMESGIEATVSLLAIAWLGAIVVPLFSGFGVDAVVSRLSGCGARLLLASTGFARRGKCIDVRPVVHEAWARLPALERVVWKGADGITADARNVDWAALDAADGATAEPLSLPADAPFMVIYTSGTTGKPKGAVHTHGGFPLKIAHDAAVHFDLQQGDRFCWPADMGWIAGTLVMSSALLRGATLVCYDGAPDFPDWSRMARLIERHRVTHFGSAPTLIRGLASHEAVALRGDVSSVRLLVTAGEGIDPEHFGWFQRCFGGGRHPLINYTGGTEVSGALLSSVVVRPIVPAGFNTGSPGIEVDVVDAGGQPLTGTVGELVVRRPFVGMSQSFWQDDERYLDSYWRTLPGLWVHGDLALRTGAGHYQLLGRSDDTIKLAGKRVGPAEIEEVVLELPTVSEAAAIGVDDPAKGQKLVVFVVPGAGAADAASVETAVQRHVDQRLGRPFRPGAVHVVAQLPKTRSSKVMRRVIRSVYGGLPPGDLSALDNPAALDAIRQLAAAA